MLLIHYIRMNLGTIQSTLPADIQQHPAIQALLEYTRACQAQIQKQEEQIQKQEALIQKQQKQIQALTEKVAKLEQENKELKDEINRLRKTPKQPKLRAGGMEPRQRSSQNLQKNSEKLDKEPLLTPAKREYSEVKVAATNVPTGARFKGYQTFIVQDLVLVAKEIAYKLEVWQAPNGQVIRAKLPEELEGKHFGANFSALAAYLYQLGMTQPALTEFFTAAGCKISTGKVNDLLLDQASSYSQESEEILKNGLQYAPYIRVDDTGEMHKHKNANCTHIGGQFFAYYKTTFSKSRQNFLNILLQGRQGYEINEAMIWHLFQLGIKDDILNLLEEHKEKKYDSLKGLNRLFNKLEITAKKKRQQCHEAAAVGYISARILKPGQVLLSDRAGQFALFNHAACWVHMERPLRKIKASSPEVELEIKQAREAIWSLYHKLKKVEMTEEEKKEVVCEYDTFLKMSSTSPAINSVIDSFRKLKSEMLKALDYSGLPLHNNDSERDIRMMVKRRNISGSTKSEAGRLFRDGLTSLKQTCFRLGLSFWDYLVSRFKGTAPNLGEIVKDRYQSCIS